MFTQPERGPRPPSCHSAVTSMAAHLGSNADSTRGMGSGRILRVKVGRIHYQETLRSLVSQDVVGEFQGLLQHLCHQ